MGKSMGLIKRLVCLALTASLILAGSVTAFADDNQNMKVQDDVSYTEESAGAPPASFDIYIQVGDDNEESDRYKITSITGQQMRLWAEKGTLKYSAASNYSNTAGRIVKEWIPLTDFASLVSNAVGYKVCYEGNDNFIMGEDFTKAEDMKDYDRAAQTGNWYSYKSMVDTKRYYYPSWDSSSDAGAVEVPAVIGIKSYGAKSGMSDTVLDMYGGSADYLWAYVVNYGQTSLSEMNYQYFWYGQSEASFRYEKSEPINQTISALLNAKIEEAEGYLANTVVDTSSKNVAQGTYWVTQYVYDCFEEAYDNAKAAASKTDSTNGEGFEAMTALVSQIETFANARQAGEKTGYFWYSKDATEYTITSSDQLWELCQIVNGVAYDESSGKSIAQDSFKGKTIYLACDIDANESKPHIGTTEHEFDGTFDGQNHTISNLLITFSNDVYTTYGYYTALFGSIGENGTVKNLTVKGKSGTAAITNYIGGLAGINYGLIENCRSYIDVTASSSYYSGGIAAFNQGTIKNCINYGAVSGKNITGGIAGLNSGTITMCANHGNISSTQSDVQCDLGGIAGDNAMYSKIENCYNIGYIAGGAKDIAGGISGFVGSSSSVKYSYNAGLLKTADSKSAAKYAGTNALIGENKGLAESLIWLNKDTSDNTQNYVGYAANGIGGNSGTAKNVEGVTYKELNSTALLGKLNSGTESFKANCGYPVLLFETAKEHTEVEEPEVAATCTKDGTSSGYYCSVCTGIIKEKTVLPAKGHTEVILPAVPATSTSTGLTEGIECSVCHAVIKAQEVIPVLRTDGWNKIDGKYYYYKDGKIQYGWISAGGKKYYTDLKTGVRAEGLTKIDAKWYYFNPNGSGEMLTGLQKMNGYWRYFDPNTGRMLTGLQKINGTWYYFQPGTGRMLTGLQKINGYWRYFDLNTGKMLTGIQKVNGYTRYFQEGTGRMLTGLQKIKGTWYYFQPGTGRMLTGLQKINGYWRYFDLNTGKMLTGIQKVNGYTRYFQEGTGRMLTGLQKINGYWYYFEQGTGRMHTGWQRINGYWRYFGADLSGKMYTGWHVIDGTNMHFGPTGICTNIEDLNPASKMLLRAQSYSSKTQWLMMVDLTNNITGVYKGSKNNWKQVYSWPCTTGTEEEPTVLGEFEINSNRGYCFGSDHYTCYYYSSFYGPYLFHSGLYNSNTFEPQDLRLGIRASAGCVRLEINNAKWVLDNIPLGTKVVTYY